MKYALLIFVTIAIATGVAYAEPNARISGSGDFLASAVLWFSGTDVTAQLSGDLALCGDLTIGKTKVAFQVKGTLQGAARGDSNTMIGSGWATFIARGMADSGGAEGEAISLHGAIDLTTNDVDLSSDTGGSATGSLYIVLTLPDQTLHLRGTATGTASGAFVRPDDPQTMQLDGEGSFSFVVVTQGASSESDPSEEDWSETALSWDTEQWPQDLRNQFVRMMQEESE